VGDVGDVGEVGVGEVGDVSLLLLLVFSDAVGDVGDVGLSSPLFSDLLPLLDDSPPSSLSDLLLLELFDDLLQVQLLSSSDFFDDLVLLFFVSFLSARSLPLSALVLAFLSALVRNSLVVTVDLS